MGGTGSGRRSNRPTTDNCLRISLSHLKQLGMLKRHCLSRRGLFWTQHGQTVADLTLVSDTDCEPHPYLKIMGSAFGRYIDCTVWLEEYRLPYGGECYYALCPNTGKRCTVLVLPPGMTQFASVKGWDVAYSSQRECPILRGQRAIAKGSQRLRALSKYARTPKRQRLRDRLIEREVFVEEAIDKLAQLVF